MTQRTQTRKRVVVTRRIFPELVAELRDEFDVVDNQEDVGWRPDELAGALKNADAALITSSALTGGRPPSLLNPEAFDKQR